MASQLLGIKTRFTNDLGSPLVGGQVYTYFAGTSTNQDSYSDAALTVPNTNPVILDDTGSADIFLKGAYRIRVFDKSGRFIEEQDNITQAASQGEATELSNKVNTLESDLSTANTELNKVKLDTGITATAKFGGVERALADKLSDVMSLKDSGASTSAADNAAYLDIAYANTANNSNSSGLGLTYNTSKKPTDLMKFSNSRFKVGKISYITRDAIAKAQTSRVANTGTYLAWAQDKCYTIGDQLIVWAMEAEAHHAGKKVPIRFQSGDGGSSWSIGAYLTNDKALQGLTLWCANFNPNNNTEYLVVRIGAGNVDVAPFTYQLWSRVIDFSDTTNYTTQPWTKKDITFITPANSTGQPVMVHSMAFGADNEVVVGAHYSGSNACLHRKLDGQDAWTTHVITTAGGPAEPTVYFDGTKWFGFVRCESQNPIYYYSLDNLATFLTYTAPVGTFGSSALVKTPVPFTVVDGVIHGFASYRTAVQAGASDKSDIPAFYIKATAISGNIWTNAEIVRLGSLKHDDGLESSAVGVGSVVHHRDKVHMFYGSEERYGYRDGLQRRAGIYQTVIPLKDNGGLFDTRDRLVQGSDETPFRRINGILAAYTRDTQEKAYVSARPNLGSAIVDVSNSAIDISNVRAGFYFLNAGTSSPNVYKITDTNAIDGDMIVLSQISSNYNITYKDSFNGGNLILAGDYTPLNALSRLTLLFYNNNWHELSRSTN